VSAAALRRRLGMGAGARIEVVAVDAFDKALDFARALHMARSSRAAGFAMNDQRLAGRAKVSR
jgi:hypothetical protein